MKGFGEEVDPKKKRKEELAKKRRELYIRTRFYEDVPFIGGDVKNKKKKEEE